VKKGIAPEHCFTRSKAMSAMESLFLKLSIALIAFECTYFAAKTPITI